MDSPIAYLERLTTYLSCLGLDSDSQMGAVKCAIVGPAQCALWLNRRKIR